MFGGSMDEVMLRPIISGPSEAGGLPALDIEVVEMEGESE
jgi:hypothetical protein